MTGPRIPGVRRDVPHYLYRCYDADDRLLYIGCSNGPLARVESHRESAWWGDRIARVRFTVFPDREYALSKEREAIYLERPICNVRSRWHKDDPREDWTLEDYRTYMTAVVRSANGIEGTGTGALVRRINAEVSDRFGVSLLPASEEQIA